MLMLGQTPSIPVVLKVPAIILRMGALFGSPEQSDVPSIVVMVSSRRWPLIFRRIRDGVSESQFNQVLIKLLRLARSADNVLHGTVIDNKVCHPKNNDFYLGTHARMIGITRQTHYHVLLDQAGFLADDLQEFNDWNHEADPLSCSLRPGSGFWLMIYKSLFILYPICIKGTPQPYLLWLLFATLIWQLHSWGQFMKIRDASETSSSHGGMYAPEVISVPQLSRLKDKVSNFILVY
ncbi:hypothetical protein GOBAR_AA34781 [Gossypium barbadense]|uniref:Piwi domain-containing protein n=1 Tax=Gossypium barbadense TaxID=3634 RepID=A0A2P5W480_GOSBA|nr:hypothetical protein GOBAR_AA34781 [Gossypium barbadense]